MRDNHINYLSMASKKLYHLHVLLSVHINNHYMIQKSYKTIFLVNIPQLLSMANSKNRLLMAITSLYYKNHKIKQLQ